MANDDNTALRFSPELWALIQKLWAKDEKKSFARAAQEAAVQMQCAVPTKATVTQRARREGWEKGVSASANTSIPVKDASSKPKRKSNRTHAPETDAFHTDAEIEAAAACDSLLKALTDKQRTFVLEYLIDLNGMSAYMRAFKTTNKASAAALGSRMLNNANVKACIQSKIDERAARTETDADRIVLEWRAMATADPNEICEYRRVCCRYCYGLEHRYQYTPVEMDEARDRHDEDRKKTLLATDDKVDIGEFDEKGGLGFNETFDPNPECPECFGEGVGQAFFKDTRKLSQAARSLYAGVKIGKEGLEVKIHSKDSALDALARHNQMFVDRHEVALTSFDPVELEARFGKTMDAARKRQDEIRAERGLSD